MTTEAQRRAKNKYRKEKVKQVVVRFYPAEKDLHEFLRAHDNVSGYIKQLVREDMMQAN